MKPILIISIVLLVVSCTNSAFDHEKEKLIVQQQLFDNTYKSLMKEDADGVVASIPEEGDSVLFQGDVLKPAKYETRQRIEDEIKKFKVLKYTYLKGPDIVFFDHGTACYITTKIKVDYLIKSDSSKTPQSYISSWLNIARKHKDKWFIHLTSQSVKEDPKE
jgi:hypothetical protein